MSREQKYYLQDSRSMVGNCMLFWAKDRKGYCTSLDEAHEFTLEEAMNERKTDIPWPVDLMRSLAKPRVDFQNLPCGDQFKRLK